MTTIATSATRLSPSARKSSRFSATCVQCLKKRKSLCAFAANLMATATLLLIMAPSSLPSRAADSPAQNDGCLTRTQAEQNWPHSHLYWHTERHCWDVTPVGQYHRHAYVPPLPAPAERQTTQRTFNHQLIEKDGGTVWVKPAAKV